MEILGKLFGSVARVKIMRLFLSNPELVFESKDVALKSKVTPKTARRELNALKSAGLIKSSSRSKKTSFSLNQSFQFIEPIKVLLVNLGSGTHQDITKRLLSVGRVKVIMLSGIFAHNWDGRIDILVVGDKVKPNLLTKVIKSIESEIGKEVHYAALDTADFYYRMGIGDKLVRDVLDYPHQIVLDKLGIFRK